MKKNKVSVIVAVYNTETYLKQCLDSIKNQTLQEIEIICVDDGSTDNSKNILYEYKRLDKRFIVLEKVHCEGTGAGPARNLGLDFATGKYIIFLDSDDFFEPDMLERVYLLAEERSAEIVLFGASIYDNCTRKDIKHANEALNMEILPLHAIFSGSEVADRLFQITWGAAWSILFERSFILKKKIRFQAVRFTDDAFFVFMALAQAENITTLNNDFVHYRINTNSSQTSRRYEYIESMYYCPLALKESLTKIGVFDNFELSFLKKWLPYFIDFTLQQKTYADFQKCYNLIRNQLSKELNIYKFAQAIHASQRYFRYFFYEYNQFMKYSPEEYLFAKLQKTDLTVDCELPQKIRNSAKAIVLYGAGHYGKIAYGSIWKNSVCQIAAWVDKNYQNIGYPVQSPDIIMSCTYDYIFISIIDADVVQEVKETLYAMGVDDSVIVTFGEGTEE